MIRLAPPTTTTTTATMVTTTTIVFQDANNVNYIIMPGETTISPSSLSSIRFSEGLLSVNHGENENMNPAMCQSKKGNFLWRINGGQLHWTMMRSLVVAVEESAVLFCILTIAHVRALIRFSLDDPCDAARDGNPPINLLIMSFYSPKWT